MQKIYDRIWQVFLYLITMIAVLTLAFVIFFIVREAMPLFEEVTVKDFLFGQRWMPIAYVGEASFGIFNFIMSTLFVSILAMVIALFLGLGVSVYLSCIASEPMRMMITPFIDLLAGIPSVIYGFIGLNVVVKLFLKLGVHTGSCILAAAIVLAVMILPYIVSGCSETILKEKQKYLSAIKCMGISKWYGILSLILPVSFRKMVTILLLAIGRAMGETMAVMMVIGNANVFPTLLGKGESIAAVIALEMGTAAAGSTHYHALYGAGLVLIIMMMSIQVITAVLKKYLLRWEA